MNAHVLFILAIASCVAADKPKVDAKKELARLEGIWTMVGLEVNGVAVPEKKLKGTTLVIRGDKYTVKVKDTSHETTFKIDPKTDPKSIDMYFPDGVEVPKLSKGVYELDGDTFKVCRHQMPGEARPTQIGSWPNTNLFVVTWKRQKK